MEIPMTSCPCSWSKAAAREESTPPDMAATTRIRRVYGAPAASLRGPPAAGIHLPPMTRHAFRAHPWHGVPMGKDAPRVVTTYIEIVPTDTVKYEIDKLTGILRMDRPQQYSNVCPSLYGFIPQTLCAERVGALCSERTGRPGIVGDGDPMDVCVLTEKPISHGDILVQAIPIGGLRMIDGREADDKIIAVLGGDAVFGSFKDISECPAPLV